jgi:hypothetical protein
LRALEKLSCSRVNETGRKIRFFFGNFLFSFKPVGNFIYAVKKEKSFSIQPEKISSKEG